MDFTTVEKNAAGIGNDGAGQDLAERRLSRAVITDEPEDLASSQHEVDAINGLDGAEGLADVLHLDPDRRAGGQHPLGQAFVQGGREGERCRDIPRWRLPRWSFETALNPTASS